MKISNWAKLDLLLLAYRRQITPEGISVFDDDQWVQCSEKYIRRDVNFRVFGESKHCTKHSIRWLLYARRYGWSAHRVA